MYKVILREVAWNLMENIFQISLNFDVALTVFFYQVMHFQQHNIFVNMRLTNICFVFEI